LGPGTETGTEPRQNGTVPQHWSEGA
jgi:hypothetical protein